MLNTSFGFSTLPFQRLVNRHTIFETDSIRFFQQRFRDFLAAKGVALIYGETGSGKTTAMQNFLTAHLDMHRFKPVFFSNYPASAKGFLRLLISNLGYLPKFHAENVLIQLTEVLTDFKAQSKLTPFFIFDEAQNMSPAVLEEVRLLTNVEPTIVPVFAFIAHGAFRDRLRLACYQPLRYRLSLIMAISPLTKKDFTDYISFHLKLAGCTHSLFSEDALVAIFNISKGLPRIINHIALETLYFAANKGMQTIDQTVVEAVALNFF